MRPSRSLQTSPASCLRAVTQHPHIHHSQHHHQHQQRPQQQKPIHRLSCRRKYSTEAPPHARLNLPIDFKTTPILHHSAASLYSSPHSTTTSPIPSNNTNNRSTTRQNLYQSINAALRHSLHTDPSVLLFGEDVAFGGVFRCSMNLATEFGAERVFNTPLTEQGIVGFAIGAAAMGMKAVAEVQFADYVYPAFDQLVNEAAKFRFREGGTGASVGGLVVRMPTMAVGHGALYHSQSPESLFTHIPGLRVIIPRSPIQAKGLLLSSILRCNDPVLFMEPKSLYRAAVEQVPTDPYFLPLDKAEVLIPGEDVTIISYGTPLYTCAAAIEAYRKDHPGSSIELIDLRTIYPWDRQTVFSSVRKTGRVVIVHEAMINAGVGAELAASIQNECFLNLEAPVTRVAGWTTHMGLDFERFNVPDVARVYDAIKKTVKY